MLTISKSLNVQLVEFGSGGKGQDVRFFGFTYLLIYYHIMKELITFLTELLGNVATLLHGDPSDRSDRKQTEELSLLYASLKILANAKNIEQVKDAIGFYIESIDLTVDGQETIWGNLIELEKQASLEMIVLANDKANLRKALNETQIELAKAREENKVLKHCLVETGQELEQEKDVANSRLEKIQRMREQATSDFLANK